MESINPAVNFLHASYNHARHLEVPMQMAHERAWFNGLQAGITPEMVADVIRHREQRIKAGVRNIECLLIRNLCGDDEKIADFIEEAYMLAARKRIRVLDPGRAQVMRATGRSVEVPEQPAKHVSESLINALRQSVG